MAGSDKASFCHVAFTNNHLPGIGIDQIRVTIKITDHTVHLYDLIDITGNNADQAQERAFSTNEYTASKLKSSLVVCRLLYLSDGG